MVALSAFYPMTGVTEQLAQWQKFAPNYVGDGVIAGTLNSFSVVQSTPAAMTVGVNTGQAFIQGVFGENGTLTTMTIAAADPTNPRIDRVVLRVDTVAKDMELQVLTGTPAPSPAAPALVRSATQTDYSLCQVAVGATVTSIVTANITDEREFASMRGIPFPNRTIASAGTINPYTGPAPLTEGWLCAQVSGTGTIVTMSPANTPPRAGSVLVLDFLSAGCSVAGISVVRTYVSGNAGGMLGLFWDGTQWIEMFRSSEQAPAHQYFGNNTGSAAVGTFVSIVGADLPGYGLVTMGSLTQGVGVAYTQNAARAIQFGKYYHLMAQLTVTGSGTAGSAAVLNLPSGVLFQAASGFQVGTWRIDAAQSYTGNLCITGGSTMQLEMATATMTFWGATPSVGLANTNVLFVSITAEVQ